MILTINNDSYSATTNKPTSMNQGNKSPDNNDTASSIINNYYDDYFDGDDGNNSSCEFEEILLDDMSTDGYDDYDNNNATPSSSIKDGSPEDDISLSSWSSSLSSLSSLSSFEQKIQKAKVAMDRVKTKLFEKYDDHYYESLSSSYQLEYDSYNRRSIEELGSRCSEISENEEFSKQGELIIQQIIMITKLRLKDREFSEQGELIQQAMATTKSTKHNRKMMTSSPTTAIHMIDDVKSKLFNQYNKCRVQVLYNNQ